MVATLPLVHGHYVRVQLCDLSERDTGRQDFASLRYFLTGFKLALQTEALDHTMLREGRGREAREGGEGGRRHFIHTRARAHMHKVKIINQQNWEAKILIKSTLIFYDFRKIKS